jgi:uncharacterized glyoxalase superfamily protein PhnB
MQEFVMNAVSPFLVIDSNCYDAVEWLKNQLANAHLTLLRTFDSNDVSVSHSECHCPHHGANACNCQVMVFMVYKKGHSSPLSLVVHGYDGSTLLYVVDTPQQRANPNIEASIRNALSPGYATLLPPVHAMAE